MRVMAIGSQPLLDGFALMGVETYAQTQAAEIEKRLNGLVSRKQRALIYLQQDLDLTGIPMLLQLRREGGDILVCEMPPLSAPGNRHTMLDDLIGRVLGPNALENSHE